MKLRLSPSVVDQFAPPLLRLLARTWRFRYVHAERCEPVRTRQAPFLILCWHEVILPLLWAHQGMGITIVVSEARDGQYLARFAASLGYRVAEGSTTRGGSRAIRGALRALREGGSVCVTPDGPRGPRRVFKGAAIPLAQHGRAAVIPVHASAQWAWRARSWDRFLLPKPWSRITITYGEPIPIGAGEVGLQQASHAVQRALDAFEDAA